MAMYEDKGLSPETARIVAEELTAQDPFSAHVDIELGIDPDALTSPWQAALSSAIAFVTGALLPLLAIVLLPAPIRIAVTFAVVVVALAATGTISAWLGGAPRRPAVTRIVTGGAIAMIITYGIGQLAGVAGI